MAAPSPKAMVEPEVLSWLRRSAGLTLEETAGKLRTKSETLAAWEAGAAQPSMSQLRKLATAFKRPLSYFYLPQPIEEAPIPHDFRRLPQAGEWRYSPALRHEIRTAHRRRTFALDLASELGSPFPQFESLATVSPEDNPETVAGRMRTLLGIEMRHQQTWRDPRAAYNAWRRPIERQGVLVFQITGVDPDEMLGLSIAYSEFPIIAINRKLRPNGRIFTMLHEFTHLLLGAGGLCDIDEGLTRNPAEQRIEVFCNHVAGAALVPKEALLTHPLVEPARPPVRDWEDTTLRALARHFSASEEVVVRRLSIVGRTSRDFYARKRSEYRARQVSVTDEDRKAGTFGRNMPLEAARNLGSFARLVLDGYHAEILNLSEASRHLGVKADKVLAVEDWAR